MYKTGVFALYSSQDFIRKKKAGKIESNIPFKTYAQDFKLIEDSNVDLIVPQDSFCCELLEQFEQLKDKVSPLFVARKLQPYICSIKQMQFDDLRDQGIIKQFGENIWALKTENMEYYYSNMGILTPSRGE